MYFKNAGRQKTQGAVEPSLRYHWHEVIFLGTFPNWEHRFIKVLSNGLCNWREVDYSKVQIMIEIENSILCTYKDTMERFCENFRIFCNFVYEGEP